MFRGISTESSGSKPVLNTLPLKLAQKHSLTKLILPKYHISTWSNSSMLKRRDICPGIVEWSWSLCYFCHLLVSLFVTRASGLIVVETFYLLMLDTSSISEKIMLFYRLFLHFCSGKQDVLNSHVWALMIRNKSSIHLKSFLPGLA